MNYIAFCAKFYENMTFILCCRKSMFHQKIEEIRDEMKASPDLERKKIIYLRSLLYRVF